MSVITCTANMWWWDICLKLLIQEDGKPFNSQKQEKENVIFYHLSQQILPNVYSSTTENSPKNDTPVGCCVLVSPLVHWY